MTVSESILSAPQRALSVAADYYRRYPGETLKLYTHVEAKQDWGPTRLQVCLPPGLIYTVSYLSGTTQNKVPQIATDQGKTFVLWDLSPESDGTLVYECQVETIVAPTNSDCALPCQSLLTADKAARGPINQQETVTILALAQRKILTVFTGNLPG